MAQLQAVRTEPDAVVVDADGRATFTLTREQLQLLETFTAFPKWGKAAKDTAAMFREMGL